MEKEFIIGPATEMDWVMHKETKPIHKIDEETRDKDILKALNEGAEYMVVRDYKNEDEFEISIIEKSNGKYRFITDSNI